MVGSDRCKTHHGARRRGQTTGRVDGLPVYYRKRLNPTLAEAVADALNVPNHEATDLYTELALMREGAGESVALYSAASQLLAEQPNSEKAKTLVVEAADCMSQNLRRVAELATTIVRNEAMSKDKLNIHTLHSVVDQITRLMFTVCGTEHQHLAEEFESRVKLDIVLPMVEAEGADLRPEDAITAMAESVPLQD